MGLLERVSRWLSPTKASSAPPSPKAGFFRNNVSPFLSSWRPPLREQYEDVRNSWQHAASRAIDSIQNSGFLSGAIEASTGAVVGTGLRLSARPAFKLLGWTEQEAIDWAELVEARFSIWASNPQNCDANRRMTFGQMQKLAYTSWMAYGEAVAMLPIMMSRDGSITKVLMTPPSRVGNRSDGMRLIQGVYIDDMGAAQAYLMTRRNFDLSIWEFVVPRYDKDGRQQVVHQFSPSMSATRGISPLAGVLQTVRQFDQTKDATVTTTLLQTIFAASLKSDLSGVTAFEGLMSEKDQDKLSVKSLQAERAEWYDASKIDLFEHGRIASLYPTDSLEFHETKHPSAQYDMMVSWFMREMSRGVGVPYETFSGDYRNATYSSTRMENATNWPIVLNRRADIVEPFDQQVYTTWLEDEIGMGRIPFPDGLNGFLANREAASQSQWSGPPQPQADDLKAARADQVLLEMGLVSVETLSAKYGIDWRTEMDRRSREKKYAESKGLPNPHPFPVDPSAQALGKRDEMGDSNDPTQKPSYTPEPDASARRRDYAAFEREEERVS